MSTLKFAETHNLVAFLDKPEENEGFEQIIDFLNASSIRYALTVNPTIYTSCIKQFWATAKIQVSDKFKTGVGYDSQVVNSQVLDSQVNDKHKIGEGYHAVPPPYTGNFMPPKPNLVLADEEEYVFMRMRKPSFANVNVVKSNEHVKTPRESVKKVENNKPFNKSTTNKNSNLNKKVNTIKENVTTAGPKAIVSDNKRNEANAVKASACWVWRPKQKIQVYNGLGKLDFEDVYFVKELKFNLFSVSQMCDKKNSVLFTDTECVVLSPDFKQLDENHVLLRVRRKDDMYNVDLKNIVPSGGRKPALSFMRPFRCPVIILNTIDHLSKFDGKADEGFFVGYSTNSKAFRVFNSRTRIVEENLHVKFIVAGNQSNGSADPSFSSSSNDSPDARFKPSGEEEKKDAKDLKNEDSEVPNT
ncbi:putative ribonuclease H-like domain-containing protein, partial [Tanacetum coccineum]